MEPLKLFEAELRFLDIIWGVEPVNSTQLCKLCEQRLGWKKPTTYTMIRKLCERGILKNENATVTSLVKREEVQRYESETLVEKSFDGSLPAFVAAFLTDKRLTKEEAAKLRRMIEEAEE